MEVKGRSWFSYFGSGKPTVQQGHSVGSFDIIDGSQEEGSCSTWNGRKILLAVAGGAGFLFGGLVGYGGASTLIQNNNLDHDEKVSAGIKVGLGVVFMLPLTCYGARKFGSFCLGVIRGTNSPDGYDRMTENLKAQNANQKV